MPSNKWDKYAVDAAPASASGPASAGSNRWDKYAEAPAPTPESHPVGDFVSNALSAINPVPAVKALWNDPVGAAKGAVNAQVDQFKKAGEDLGNTREMPNFTDRIMSAGGHALAGAIPFVGPAAANAGEQIGNGDVAGGLGSAAGLLAGPHIPGLMGKGLGAIAPKMAETAMRIQKGDRAFGRTPGESIINETTGVRPESVAASANSKLGELNPQLERATANSTNMADLQPARDVIGGAKIKALKQNSATIHKQLDPLESHLSTDLATGQPIPQNVTPSQLLDLKRGFGEEHTRWNPEVNPTVNNVGRKAYGALDSELDRTVPEAAGLNQRISSLIPVAKRAESTARNADVGQRIMGRVMAHTGALTGAGLGFHYGGLPGAVAGLAIPELLGSPTAQMVAARSANASGKALQNPITKAGTRMTLTGKRKEEKQ